MAKPASITATEAKNGFGRLLEKTIRGATFVITKHDAPKAVLLPVEEFERLSQGARAGLEGLSREFDDLLAGMQTRKARAAMKAAFQASPKQLGRAAAGAARKRG